MDNKEENVTWHSVTLHWIYNSNTHTLGWNSYFNDTQQNAQHINNENFPTPHKSTFSRICMY